MNHEINPAEPTEVERRQALEIYRGVLADPKTNTADRYQALACLVDLIGDAQAAGQHGLACEVLDAFLELEALHE